MSKSRFKTRNVLNKIYETASLYKTYILIIYCLTQVSDDIWDEIGYMGHAHMPRRYHTRPGKYPNPSDSGPERQRDILRYIRIRNYAQAAESGLYTSFLLFHFS